MDPMPMRNFTGTLSQALRKPPSDRHNPVKCEQYPPSVLLVSAVLYAHGTTSAMETDPNLALTATSCASREHALLLAMSSAVSQAHAKILTRPVSMAGVRCRLHDTCNVPRHAH
eukprot:scaffold128539_cov31-Tisochrysis_lutea.AAC.3